MSSPEYSSTIVAIGEAESASFLEASQHLLPAEGMRGMEAFDVGACYQACYEVEGTTVVVTKFSPCGERTDEETSVEVMEFGFDAPSGHILTTLKRYSLARYPDGDVISHFEEKISAATLLPAAPPVAEALSDQTLDDKLRRALEVLKLETALGLTVFTVEKFQEVMALLAQCGPHNQEE